MRGGYAADDGVALHFRGTRLQRAVSSSPQAGAYTVAVSGGRIRETRLTVSYLGEDAVGTPPPARRPSASPPEARRPTLVAA